MAEDTNIVKGLNELQILLYVCTLLKAARPHIKNPLLYAAKASKKNCMRKILKVKRVSLKAFQNKSRPIGVEYDLNSVAFVSPKTAAYLNVKDWQWVRAKCDTKPNSQDQATMQLVKTSHRWILIRISSDVPDEQCIVSPILFHNLSQNNHEPDIAIEFINDYNQYVSSSIQKMFVLWQNAHNKTSFTESDASFNDGPQYASEVQVKYVESVKYKCGHYLEELINDHFEIPKAVTNKDVLVIPIPFHLAFEFANSDAINPPTHVLIKVCCVKIRSGAETQHTMLLNKGVTSLYLSGSTRCSIPLLGEDHTVETDEISIPPILKNSVDNLRTIIDRELENKLHESHESGFDAQVCLDCKDKCSSNSHNSNDEISEDIQDLDSEVNPHHASFGASASVLFIGPPGSGIEFIVNAAAADLGLEVLWIDCWHLKGDTSGATESRVRQTFLRALSQSPCVLALHDVHCIAIDHDGNDDGRVVTALKEEITKVQQQNVFVIATSPDRLKISADLWSIWSHQETVNVPDLPQRSAMLEWLFSVWLPKTKIQTLAQRTAGYIFGDFEALYFASQRMCLQRLHSDQTSETTDNSTDGKKRTPPLTYKDLLNALDELQTNRSKALGAPRIPQVRWSEIGGLEDAKREVVNTIQLPLRHPSLVASGLRRSGVLLYGPPGTGKTLLAKAVATECGLNFMSVKGPELLNMYVGQSEENVRQVFARARAAAPCVIFFDELDSLAPNRGRSGDSGGVMDRIVSALLAELDGVASSADVFVLAATNRPDLIDPALLRPGRFEKLVFLGVCEDRAGQVKILQAVTSKVQLADSVSLERVADMLPLTLTGADLYALCTDALYIALHRTTNDISEGKIKEEEAEILVLEEDFQKAANQLVPSVTPQELVHYRNMNVNKR